MNQQAIERLLWKGLLQWQPSQSHDYSMSHTSHTSGIQRWVRGGFIQTPHNVSVQVHFWSPSLKRIILLKPPLHTPTHLVMVKVSTHSQASHTEPMPYEELAPLLHHAGWEVVCVAPESVLGDLEGTLNRIHG
ncbi:MAG: hypothetical protein ACKO37_05810 [Vampirovibrionales bacterium]